MVALVFEKKCKIKKIGKNQQDDEKKNNNNNKIKVRIISKTVRFISTFCIWHISQITKSYMLTTFFATSEYWKYFYCAFESSKVIEEFMFDKVEENQSTNERCIGPNFR